MIDDEDDDDDDDSVSCVCVASYAVSTFFSSSSPQTCTEMLPLGWCSRVALPLGKLSADTELKEVWFERRIPVWPV